jgi:methionyl-tRNA synthetase
VDETYAKVRKYMYQNPKNCDFINIVEDTGVSDKELNYLIKKGRIEVADRSSGTGKCRACGKETSSGSICEQCMAKIVAEKLAAKKEAKPEVSQEPGKKGAIPISYREKA